MHPTDALTNKITAVGLATGQLGVIAWAASVSWLNGMFAEIGISAAMIFMAVTGVAAGLLGNPPEGTRSKLYGRALMYVAYALSVGKLLPAFSLTAWLDPVAPALCMFAGLYAQRMAHSTGEGISKLISSWSDWRKQP